MKDLNFDAPLTILQLITIQNSSDVFDRLYCIVFIHLYSASHGMSPSHYIYKQQEN